MPIQQVVRSVADTDTLLSAFRRTVAERGGEVAVRAHDGALALSWDAVAERSTALAAGLAALGLGRGDTVALLLRNRPEFVPLDLAAVTIGAVTVSLYATSAPPQLQHVISDAGAAAVVTESGLVARLDGLALPPLRFVVDDEPPPGWRSLGEVVAAGAGTAFDPPEPHPDDVITMIYTSGTTGNPKGVQITHRGVLATAVATNSVLGLPPGTTVISWLPSAHVGDRCGGYYIPMVTGWEVVTCGDPRAVLDVLAGAHPGYFYGPPRIFEKLRSDFASWRAGLAPDVGDEVDHGLAAGYAEVSATQAGAPVPPAVAADAAAFRAGPLREWKRSVGIDRLVVVLVATAPNPGPIMEFFHAIGIPMGEAYGLTESSGSGTVVAPDAIRIGTVGTASRGIELRIGDGPDDGGEVLLRGPQIMAGYHNLPQATAAAIDADGWLHTGDLGSLDADGYLSIVGRAKELIISAQGKNIAPVTVESAIGPESPLIGQICCVGDARPYLVALVVLDPGYAATWAARHGVPVDRVAHDERAFAEIAAAVDRGNAKLSRPEQVKRFRVLPAEWLPGGDELTPTAKLRRHRIVDRYADVIDELYASEKPS